MNNYHGKTVLVTGATGLIGSHIVDYLMTLNDVNVIALSRSEEKLKKGFSQYIDNPHFHILAQDVISPINIAFSVDYIFHAAGPMEGKIIKQYPMDIIHPNLTGTLNCLDFLKKQKEDSGKIGRLILFSSVTVYGNNTNADYTFSENDTRVTENLDALGAPYSQSKRMSEVIALAYARQHGANVVICRFSTIYGSTRFLPDTAFYEFVRKGITGEDILLNNSGLPRRDNLYIDDAVQGALLVGSIGKSGEAYNISSNGDGGNFASVDEIAHLIAEQFISSHPGHNMRVLFKENHSGTRAPGMKLNNQKLKSLGWSVTVSLSQGIAQTIYELKKQMNVT